MTFPGLNDRLTVSRSTDARLEASKKAPRLQIKPVDLL